MNKTCSHRTLPILVGIFIVCFSIGAFADVSVGTSVGFTKTFTRTRVVQPEHVCRYEERPVVKTYTDATGGRYEHRTHEMVRICDHTEVVAVPATTYRAPRPRVRRSTISYSIGVGFYDGGHGYYGSSYYGHGGRHYRPRHHYGHHDSHRGYRGHRSHKKGGHRGRH